MRHAKTLGFTLKHSSAAAGFLFKLSLEWR
jgi:hypothetical protein